MKSVLGNLPTYYLSLFKAPKGVLDSLEKLRRRFLWGGSENKKKIHWVSWKKVLASKNKGGLGVGSIYALNIGLIVKWWWRLKTCPDTLWCKIIRGFHKLDGKPHHYISSNSITGVWKNISKAKIDIQKINLSFYDFCKMQTDPIDANKEIWKCSLKNDGSYTVEVLRKIVDQTPSLDSPSVVKWCKEIPIKVICFVWRAAIGRIPSAEALSSRGIPVSTLSCGLCGEIETVDHILVSCPIASKVRDWICNWCGISLDSPTSTRGILDFVSKWGRCPKKRNVLTMIAYGLFWSLWRARNDKSF